MNIMNQTFEYQRIDLHGKSYQNCSFQHCELVYDGGRSPTFSDNEFIDSVFVFSGPALRTLYFLGNLYNSGDGGREVMEQTIDDLKNRKIHGHEVRTTKPSTEDRNLSGSTLQ
ncbi:MAG: hypothetical protein WCY88_08695 [Spongiibacteraceae bacterium]